MDPGLGVIDPAPMQRFVTEDAYIRQGIGTTGRVIYRRQADRAIGRDFHGSRGDVKENIMANIKYADRLP